MTFGFTHVPRQWLRLTWPRDVTVDQATAALRAVNGLSTLRRSEATVLQIVGTTEGIEHYLAVPEPRAEAACRQLRQAITGLGIESVDTPGPLPLDRAWRVWVSTRRRPLARFSKPCQANLAPFLRQSEERVDALDQGVCRRPVQTDRYDQHLISPAELHLPDLSVGPSLRTG